MSNDKLLLFSMPMVSLKDNSDDKYWQGWDEEGPSVIAGGRETGWASMGKFGACSKN